MRLLVKVGGTLLDEPSTRSAIARELAHVARQHELTLVHGGGKQMTRFLEERGIQSRFINGLRVSDDAVIDAASKVIAGSVNTQFVSALIAAGQPALGLSGVDGALTLATQLDPDLGFVGRPLRSDGRLLEYLLRGGYLPVVACIAGDRDGTVYNVNADQMAVSCALAFHAETLIFLTDVPGVRDAAGNVLPSLTDVAAQELIRSGVASGGMQAKLEAALAALHGGVKAVVVAPGQEPGVCLRLVSGDSFGTRLTLSSTTGGTS